MTFATTLAMVCAKASRLAAEHAATCESWCGAAAHTPCADGLRIAALVLFLRDLRQRTRLAELANGGDATARQTLLHLDDLRIPPVLTSKPAASAVQMPEFPRGGRR